MVAYVNPYVQSGSLRQGELLSNVTHIKIDISTIEQESPDLEVIIKDYVVVLTQECDLLQDYNKRQEGQQSDLQSILFCEARLITEMPSTVSKDKFRQNEVQRYHFLSSLPQCADNEGLGIGALILDFKSCFSLPIEEIYKRIEMGECKRRGLLATPYEAHLSCRCAGYLSRIALPTPHHQVEVEASTIALPSAA